MGCSFQEEIKYTEKNLEQLLLKKKTMIENFSNSSKKPSNQEKIQMDILDKHVNKELFKLQKMSYNKDKNLMQEVIINKYNKIKNDFENLVSQWEKIINDNENKNKISSNKEVDVNNLNDVNNNSSDIDNSSDVNNSSDNNNNNGKNEIDEDEDSSKFAKEESEGSAIDPIH